MKKLTNKQRQTLLRIQIIRNQATAALVSEYGADCRPSPWVRVDTIVRVHKQKICDVNSLVKKGYLEWATTDGLGNEVRLTMEEF